MCLQPPILLGVVFVNLSGLLGDVASFGWWYMKSNFVPNALNSLSSGAWCLQLFATSFSKLSDEMFFFQQLLADKQLLSCDNPAATHFVPSRFCSCVANLVISPIII